MTLGKRDYQTHDESDAVAIALCHLLNSKSITKVGSSKGSSGLAKALAHKIGN